MTNERSSMIDWDTAVSVGARLAGEGPSVSRVEADDVVAELRAGAERSSPLVRGFTGLVAEERTAPVLIVDRRGWLQANVDGFAEIVSPLIDRLQAKKGPPSPFAHAVGSRVTGAELGLMLGFMSGKVLGQFDPFHERRAPPGGCCWSRRTSSRSSASSRSTPTTSGSGCACTRRRTGCSSPRSPGCATTSARDGEDHRRGPHGPVRDAGRGHEEARRRRQREGRGSLLDLVSSPEQKEVIERITGVMSLLEGHADVVMDGVGPEVIPSVATIRAKFTERRKGMGVLDRLIAAAGLDQKMAQYRDGAVFTRARRRQGRHGRLQRGLGRAGQPASRRPRSSRRRRGSPGSTAEPRLSDGAAPSVAAVRLGVRRCSTS
jgi:uncharacterized protein (DUF2342 family)